jgi:hypothetical protein
MRPKTELRFAIDLRRRWHFKQRDVRACTIDDPKRWLMRIYIDLGAHAHKMRTLHRSLDWMIQDLIDSIAHEYAHAFTPVGVDDKAEEQMAKKFASAARWVSLP